jgi:nucleotide-binding universal stress UspA family protein
MVARILLTVDGSDLSLHAAPVATALARAAGATLDVLSVADELPIQTTQNYDARNALAVARQAAEVLAWSLRSEGVEAEATAVVGDPVDEIVRHASASGACLLVMATHGRGGLGRALFGSVADAVVRRSAIPVVLVRAWDDGAARQPPHGTPTILVPLDGSALAEVALPAAFDLAELLRGELVLVRVLQAPVAAAQATGALGPVIEIGTSLDDERDEAAAYLAARASTAPAGVAVATAVETGPAADAIMAVAVARRASLIVMATHGHGGILRTLFGSVTERVVRFGPCPVAVVRPDTVPAASGGG